MGNIHLAVQPFLVIFDLLSKDNLIGVILLIAFVRRVSEVGNESKIIAQTTFGVLIQAMHTLHLTFVQQLNLFGSFFLVFMQLSPCFYLRFISN